MDDEIKKGFEEIKNEIFKINQRLFGVEKQQEIGAVNGAYTTACSGAKKDSSEPFISIQKRVSIKLKKIQITKAIQHYIKEGYSTNQMRDEITLRFKIKKRRFFDYLKLAKELPQLSATLGAT